MHESTEEGLVCFAPLTASVTTELAVGAPVRYLAVWRVAVETLKSDGLAWERIKKAAAPRPACLFVPAFTLMRPVVQRLGVRLTKIQPELELTPGLAAGTSQRPPLVEIHEYDRPDEGAVAPGTAPPDFGPLSPIVVGREDARILAHFVYLAVESHDTQDLRSVEYDLEPVGEELLFIPAVWDPRYIHESNWRLLLREFDNLVA